jgi:hypothetical protein
MIVSSVVQEAVALIVVASVVIPGSNDCLAFCFRRVASPRFWRLVVMQREGNAPGNAFARDDGVDLNQKLVGSRAGVGPQHDSQDNAGLSELAAPCANLVLMTPSGLLPV